MNNWDYVREVSALHAPDRLRRKIAALPTGEKTRAHNVRPYRRWAALAAALVLVVGLGVAAPAILRATAPQGGEVDPPVASVSDPEGIIATGIDVSPVILDAAKEYVGEQYAACVAEPPSPEGQAVFDNWRIEQILPTYERKELGDLTVSVYRVDYRIHTTTPDRVILAGAREIDADGWLMPTYPESTYLVFILNYSTSHYFATMINDCSPGSELFDETLATEVNAYIAGLGEDAVDTWGITLRVENATDTGLTLVIEQSGGNTDGMLMTGDTYTLERYVDGAWTVKETATGEPPISQQNLDSIPREDSVRWEIDLSQIYHPLAPGKYRIAKEFSDFRAAGEYDKKVYYAEFSIIDSDGFSTLDFNAYKDVMTAEEWDAMEGFLPVLLEGASFSWTEGTALAVQGDITLDEFLPQIWSMAEGETELHLWQLAVADADGDGNRDLVLALKDAGYHYLILHREGDKLYGIDFPVRWFEGLQTNGVFVGSGGASYQSYYKMAFENGSFKKENLGSEAWSSDTDGTFDIGGQAVDADTFVAWREELMVGDVTWYEPIPKA